MEEVEEVDEEEEGAKKNRWRIEEKWWRERRGRKIERG